MTPDEFFETMTGPQRRPDCNGVAATLRHSDQPGNPYRVVFRSLVAFQVFMAGAPAFAKSIGDDGKVSITLSCECGHVDPMVVQL